MFQIPRMFVVSRGNIGLEEEAGSNITVANRSLLDNLLPPQCFPAMRISVLSSYSLSGGMVCSPH